MIELHYSKALELQRQNRQLLCFSPPPVVTAGKSIRATEMTRVAQQLRGTGVELLATERGGKFTFHYPGQLIIFPAINIAAHGIGPKSFVERSLQAVSRALSSVGLGSKVRLDQAGVWTADATKKICSIGIKIERGAILHGLALNISAPDSELSKTVYNLVDICGLSGSCISSIEEEIGSSPDFDQIEQLVTAEWNKEFGAQ